MWIIKYLSAIKLAKGIFLKPMIVLQANITILTIIHI